MFVRLKLYLDMYTGEYFVAFSAATTDLCTPTSLVKHTIIDSSLLPHSVSRQKRSTKTVILWNLDELV